MSDNPIFNVSSFNQHGGITAGQVNIGTQPRHLGEGDKQKLRQHLPHNKKVRVVAVMGDGEALSFAQQIRDFLASDGFDVSGVDQAIYSKPVMGQGIQATDDGFEVIIGTRQ